MIYHLNVNDPGKSQTYTSILSRYQDFLKHAILQDQTYIVKFLLNYDPHYLAYIQNLQEFHVVISEGNITGGQSVIKHHIEKCETELKGITLSLSHTNDPALLEKLTVLSGDIAKLKAAKAQNREVYQWLLVSPLMAEMLIMMEEVVLQVPGSSYWGIYNSRYSFATIDDTLLEIFEELTYQHKN